MCHPRNSIQKSKIESGPSDKTLRKKGKVDKSTADAETLGKNKIFLRLCGA